MNPDETQQLIIDESATARQLRAGFPWLRFEPDLEQEFRRELFRSRLRQVRSNLYLAAALMLGFALLNTLVLDTREHFSFYLIQFCIALPSVGGMIALTYHHHAYRAYQRYAPLLVALVGVSVVVVERHAARDGIPILFVGVLLTSIYIYYLAGLLFYEALRANAILWGAYIVAGIVFGLQQQGVLYNALVLLIANIVGATVGYRFEIETRTHFLENQMLQEMAARDGLTGLYNRRRFDEHLETAWHMALREGATLALLLVDIDFFKRFNDRHGHQAGDECLKAVAAALARAARRPLDFTARYGGEEFALILYDPTPQYLREITPRVHANVASLGIPHGDSDVASAVTISIGVAHVVPTRERSPAGFLQLADEALYEAKALGRNRSVFSETAYAELETGSFRSRNRR